MAVLEYPADLVRYVLEHVYGETDPATYEPTSWIETRGEQANAGLVWAVRLLPTPFIEFCALVSRQSNADLYQSAGLWVYRWRAARAPVATFTPGRNITTPVTFGRRPFRTALAARLAVSWDLEHATGQYRHSEVYVSALVNRLEPAQLGRRVRTDQPIDLTLPYVISPATAKYLGRTALTRVEQQRWTVEVATDWDALPIEKGDTILIESPVLVASLGTSLGTFLVTAKRYDPATDAIVLEAEEAPTAVLTRTLTFAIRARGPGTTRLLTFAIQRLLITRSLTFAVGIPPAGLTLIADPGSYTVTGTAATLSVPGRLAAEAGAYAITGTAATLIVTRTYTLSASPGSYAITGTAADLTVAGGGPAPGFVNGQLGSSSGSTNPSVINFTTGADANYLVLRYVFGIATATFVSASGAPSSGPTVTFTEIGTVTAPTNARLVGIAVAPCAPNMAYTVTVTWGGSVSFKRHILAAYKGVGSVGTPVTATITGSGTVSLNVAAGAGALVIEAIGTAATIETPGTGQTREVTPSTGDPNLGGSYKAGTGTLTMTDSTSGGALGAAMIGVALFPP